MGKKIYKSGAIKYDYKNDPPTHSGMYNMDHLHELQLVSSFFENLKVSKTKVVQEYCNWLLNKGPEGMPNFHYQRLKRKLNQAENLIFMDKGVRQLNLTFLFTNSWIQ